VAERIGLAFDTDLRRRRLPVLLRLLLALPAAVILLGWTVAAALGLLLGWPATVAFGRMPRLLHRILHGYLEYTARFHAWFTLVSGAYPRPTRRRPHPVLLEAPRESQARLSALFRFPLALPGLVLGSVLGVVLVMSGGAAWFVALARGRTTEGLRELGAFCLRYQVEVLAYAILLSACSPRLAPPATGAQ
jgi:hypothetical protein